METRNQDFLLSCLVLSKPRQTKHDWDLMLGDTEGKFPLSSRKDLPAFTGNILGRNLIKDSQAEALLPLLREIEGSVLQPPLEGEHMHLSAPLLGGHYQDVGLFMETKEEGESVYVSQGCQGVRHRHQSYQETYVRGVKGRVIRSYL